MFVLAHAATAAKDLLTLPLAHRMVNDSSVVPIRSANPLVEVGYISAPGLGVAFPCVNWNGKEIKDFTVTDALHTNGSQPTRLLSYMTLCCSGPVLSSSRF